MKRVGSGQRWHVEPAFLSISLALAFGAGLAAIMAWQYKSACRGIHYSGAKTRLGRLLAALDAIVQGASDGGGIGALGVADLPGFMDLLLRQPDIRGSRQKVRVPDLFRPPLSGDLTSFLRSVVFFGEPGAI